MKVFQTPDSKVKTIPGTTFVQLMEQYMGPDAVKYYRQEIGELCSCARDLCRYIGDADLKVEVEEVIAAHEF